MKIIKEHFNSINELLKQLELRDKNEIMKYEDSSNGGSYDFTLTRNYEEAKNLLIYGYDEPLDKIKKKIKINGTRNNGIKIENNVYGYVPNVANALQGLPKSMINISTQPKKINVLDIIYAPVGNSYVQANEFIDAGIKLLNVINSLELNGIKVKLRVAFKCSKSNSEITLGTVQLKNYYEQLNLLKICFPITHPSFLRRIGFRWLETSPQITDDYWNIGYGQSLDVNSVSYIELTKSLGKQEKILIFNEVRSMTEEEMIKKLFE